MGHRLAHDAHDLSRSTEVRKLGAKVPGRILELLTIVDKLTDSIVHGSSIEAFVFQHDADAVARSRLSVEPPLEDPSWADELRRPKSDAIHH